MGNICRSPTAEGVFKKKLADNLLHPLVYVASDNLISIQPK